MPVVYKLSPEEVKTELSRGKSQRQLMMEQYDAMLEGFGVTDWGEVKLEPSDKRATVRNRLKSAAGRKGHAIRFKRGQGDSMRFEILNADDPAAMLPDEDDEGAADADNVVAPVLKTSAPKPARRSRTSTTATVGSDEAPVRRRGRPRTSV